MQGVYNDGEFQTTPEKALISSYVIKLLNRNASSKVDRLLKDDYEDIKRNPLILDTILRAQLMAFFSETGCEGLTKELMKYYRKYKLYSALIDAKNLLVICSKEGINRSGTPMNKPMEKVVLELMDNNKTHIVRNHIKSALASCILTGNLSSNFDTLIDGGLEGLIAPEIEELVIRTAEECKKELYERIENSKPNE